MPVTTLRPVATLRGHPIEWDGQRWRYVDNGAPTVQTHATTRPCGTCGEHRTPEGHDPCIGTLVGVMNACCGHGRISAAYIQYKDGTRVEGAVALERMGRW